MMPEIDGFTLCRTLRRDVALHDVPVILLSWKEDLLQRVRELGAGAAGYIRKETDTRAIVARVREALRPRSRIETRLREDGEVRGRMDGVSVAHAPRDRLCDATRGARHGPRRIVQLRGGDPRRRSPSRDAHLRRRHVPRRRARPRGDARRRRRTLHGRRRRRRRSTRSSTATSPRSSRSPSPGRAPPRRSSPAPAPCGRARSTSTRRCSTTTCARCPSRRKKIALRIADGTSPRALILEGSFAASLVEDIVCDLAARGIVTGIEDDMGEDILGPEVTRLAAYTDTRAAFGPRTATPEPVPAGADGIAKMPAPGACAGDNGLGLCESPEPGGVNRAAGEGASLEDAVVREVAFRSPEPAPLGLPVIAPPRRGGSALRRPTLRTKTKARLRTIRSSRMAEATIVENTTYAEREAADVESAEAEGAEGAERSIPIDEASGPMHPSESRAMKTPLTAVTTRESELAGLPSKSKTWPMVAFVAAGRSRCLGGAALLGGPARRRSRSRLLLHRRRRPRRRRTRPPRTRPPLPKTTSRRATASSRSRRPATPSSSSTAPSADAAAPRCRSGTASTTFASAASRASSSASSRSARATSLTSSSDGPSPLCVPRLPR